MITYLVRGFPGAFAECSDWLASWCVPWRWVVEVDRQCLQLRREAGAEVAR